MFAFARIAEPPTWEAYFLRSNGFAARTCASHFQFTWVALAATFALQGNSDVAKNKQKQCKRQTCAY